MKNFWLGFALGAFGTLLLCGGLFVVTNVALAQRTRASIEHGEPSPPIVMRGLFGSRGEVGTIDAISAQTITLKARDGGQKTVRLTDETIIYRAQSKIALSALNPGERILVIGAAQSDGSIKAKWIRVFSISMVESPYSAGG